MAKNNDVRGLDMAVFESRHPNDNDKEGILLAVAKGSLKVGDDINQYGTMMKVRAVYPSSGPVLYPFEKSSLKEEGFGLVSGLTADKADPQRDYFEYNSYDGVARRLRSPDEFEVAIREKQIIISRKSPISKAEHKQLKKELKQLNGSGMDMAWDLAMNDGGARVDQLQAEIKAIQNKLYGPNYIQAEFKNTSGSGDDDKAKRLRLAQAKAKALKLKFKF